MSYSPTTGLRFIQNTQGRLILQQLFLEEGAKQVWFDVPLREGKSREMDNPPIKVPGHPLAMISIEPAALDVEAMTTPQLEQTVLDLQATLEQTEQLRKEIEDLKGQRDDFKAEAMDLRQRNNQASTNYSALLQAKNDLEAELRQVKTDKGNSEAELARAKEELAAIRAIIHKDMRGDA